MISTFSEPDTYRSTAKALAPLLSSYLEGSPYWDDVAEVGIWDFDGGKIMIAIGLYEGSITWRRPPGSWQTFQSEKAALDFVRFIG